MMICVLCPSRGAWATDQMDVAIALRTLPLLVDKVSNQAAVAIVYNPSILQSLYDAQGIKESIAARADSRGGGVLTPVLVSVNQMASLSGTKVAFMANGLSLSEYKSASSVAAAANVLTISTDLACVQANQCILGIVSQPKVKIFYSPVAAEAAKISFVSAFTMLVNQVSAP